MTATEPPTEPTTLEIGVKPWKQFKRDAIAKARQFDAELKRDRASDDEPEDHPDDESPDPSPRVHSHYFQDIAHLHHILTPKHSSSSAV